MTLDAHEVREYFAADGGRGLCKLWLCRGRNVAICVLTELPGDPAPTPLIESFALAAAQVVADFALSPATTLWFHRKVLAKARPGGGLALRERWTEIDLAEVGDGSLAVSDIATTLRSAAEIAAGLAFPEIDDADYTAP